MGRNHQPVHYSRVEDTNVGVTCRADQSLKAEPVRESRECVVAHSGFGDC